MPQPGEPLAGPGPAGGDRRGPAPPDGATARPAGAAGRDRASRRGPPGGTGGRVLLTGWFSFLDGEVTAGDVLALRRVQEVLDTAGVPYDTAWSPGYRPSGLRLAHADPDGYCALVFVCGPLHGPQVEQLHRRFARCRRIAVGTSVIDDTDPASTGFDHIVARDAPHTQPRPDLSAGAPPGAPRPVAGVVLTRAQGEYGERRRHDDVARTVTRWLAGKDCARLAVDTRLDAHDWRLAGTADQLMSVLARLDVVVTDRLHGLLLALRAGVPALAVDPVAGGAKVTAQALACRWPAVLAAEDADEQRLDAWWDWCLTSGRALVARRRAQLGDAGRADGTEELVAALAGPGPVSASREGVPSTSGRSEEVSGVADALETEALWNEFHRVVNMTSQELGAWLRTSDAGEHTEPLPDQAGAPIGRHVLGILQKRRTDLTDDDIRVMRKVVDLVESAREESTSEQDVVRHRDRLMALGHDPLKPG